MANEWIKMRCDLDEDPAVIGIAAKLGIDEQDVVGRLHRVWKWASQQTRDGNAAGVTGLWVDRYVRTPGFAQAMADMGWLVISGEGVTIPKFDSHMSQSAKTRAVTAKRVSDYRNAGCNGVSVTESVPEKRREDKKSNTPLPPNVVGAVEAAETDGVLPPVEPAENIPAISDRFTLADIKHILAAYPLKMNMHAAKLRVSYALTDIANDTTHPGRADPVAWLTARVEAYAKSRLGKRKPKNPADWFSDRRYDDADEAWNAGGTDKEMEAEERQRKAAGQAAAMEEARKRRLREEAKAMAEAEKDNRSLIEIKNKAIAEAKRRNGQTPPTLANVIEGVKI
jgi:hypothetical protein